MPRSPFITEGSQGRNLSRVENWRQKQKPRSWDTMSTGLLLVAGSVFLLFRLFYCMCMSTTSQSSCIQNRNLWEAFHIQFITLFEVIKTLLDIIYWSNFVGFRAAKRPSLGGLNLIQEASRDGNCLKIETGEASSGPERCPNYNLPKLRVYMNMNVHMHVCVCTCNMHSFCKYDLDQGFLT